MVDQLIQQQAAALVVHTILTLVQMLAQPVDQVVAVAQAMLVPVLAVLVIRQVHHHLRAQVAPV
jgi:hypothetical protein